MLSRLDRLRARLAELKLDALVVSRNEDQRYLVNFSGHADFDSVLLVSGNDVRIATDSRYLEKASQDAPGYAVIQIKRQEYEIGDAMGDLARENKLSTIGFDAEHVPFARVRQWNKSLKKTDAKLKPTQDIVKWLRAVKDETEIDKIRRAVKLTDEAFAFFCERVKPGLTEKQGAWLIEVFLRERGGERLAFDPIIASGPNAALPHAEPTDRVIQPGEPLTVDIGVVLDGYCSDLTRTITLGEPSQKFREVYQIVLEAQRAVEQKARPGMRGKQIDRLARKVIENAGYGDQFGHGTGHGVGRVVHEFPRAGKHLRDVVEPNMTLTVEPGIYIPGWGGVRIEDLCVLRPDGIQILTDASKEPRVPIRG